jgi:Fur family transcriptional regulator, iron response regulator
VQPSAQRIAVGEYVLYTDDHPSADDVLAEVTRSGRSPMLSRATVYNTLNLFVDKGLLRQLTLAEGRVVFDPEKERHHHFIDEATGRIHDVPWSALEVSNVAALAAAEGYDVREYQVVLRGSKKTAPKKRPR